MNNEIAEKQNGSGNPLRVLAGILVGALTGAAVVLLLAPQSGKDTREQIREKGIQLRDQATGFVDETVSQVRSISSNIASGGRAKFEELKQQGQDLAVNQLDHLTKAAKAGKKAIQGS